MVYIRMLDSFIVGSCLVMDRTRHDLPSLMPPCVCFMVVSILIRIMPAAIMIRSYDV